MLARLERNLPWILVGLGIILLIGAIAQVFLSLPPHSFTFLSGREGGAYYLGAQLYGKIAAEKGFAVNIVPTAGSVEALHMLEEGKGDVAFVQGGVAAQGNPEIIGSLATVAFEPVWIFYRHALSPDKQLDTLPQLKGMRIGIGEPGSGTNQLARQLLSDGGIDDSNSTLLELPTSETHPALQEGTMDVAFLVANTESPALRDIVADRSLDLVNLRHADALARRHRFLTVLTLPEGTLDLVNVSPPTDIKLVATEANLVVRNELHPDLLRLLTIAAVELHGPGGFFADRNYFPNTQNTDLPISREAMTYVERIKSGDSTLDRYFPFWLAALVDRYLLFILPIALIVLPLLGRSPLLYQAYMRNKVNRWYKLVHGIELRVDKMQLAEIDAAIAELEEVDQKITHELTVSNSYMPNVYDLRTHVQYVIGQIEKRKVRLMDTPIRAPDKPIASDLASTT